MKESKQKESITYRISRFIVDKRKGIYIFFVVAILFCISSVSKVKVNNDIASYLPATTETRRGLTVMEEEFREYGSARIMVANVTYEYAQELAEHMENTYGVDSVTFDDTPEHYKNASALFEVSFDAEADNETSVAAMTEIKEYLSDLDTYIVSEVGKDESASLQSEMRIILMIAAVVIVGVLLFTSKTYLEVVVFIIVFGVAALLNMGTNYWLGEISFITNAIAIVLQLALAIDYAIILCHRFMEEREALEQREAVITALSKALIEISSSSLTTIAGLFALTFMQLRIGFDMGIVLMKGILCSLLTVFLLMPGLLMMFGKGIEKTRHKNFVPGIRPWGKLMVKCRYVLPVVLVVLIVVSVALSGHVNYVFSNNTIDTGRPSEERIAMDKINTTFGESNTIAMLVPKGNYDSERKILNQISELDKVNSALGLANVETDDHYMLTDRMVPQDVSEMVGVDIELVRLLYQAYGLENKQYGSLFMGVDEYSVPLIDMLFFLGGQLESGAIRLDEEQQQDILDLYDTLVKAKSQLEGEHWSRLVFTADLPEECEESFALLEEMRGIAAKYYGNEVMLVGNTTNAKDLQDSFGEDSSKINIITVLAVMAILLFTFKSSGIPILLILCIQGSIWINFAFPVITGSKLFFLAYLVVSSIQMGATIDYAIVMTSRYMDLKKTMSAKEAMIEALDQSFPTVLTSGSIMTVAGFLIAAISTNAIIASVGLALGRGTFISIVIVMTVLPQLLLIGDKIIEKTAFTLKEKEKKDVQSVAMVLDGTLSGENDVTKIRAVVYGRLNAAEEEKKRLTEAEISLPESGQTEGEDIYE